MIIGGAILYFLNLQSPPIDWKIHHKPLNNLQSYS
jgi:hypothetical protein